MKSAISQRRFNLLDAMILVAAIAVGTSLTQWMGTSYWRGRRQWTDWWDIGRVSTWIVSLAVPWLIVGTLSYLAIRLRPPRPPLRRLCRQPGFAALGVMSAILALDVVITLPVTLVPGLTALVFGGEFPREAAVLFLTLTGLTQGGAGLGVWVLQRLAGQWRPERTWIDRSGCTLAAGWILTFSAGWTIACYNYIRYR